MLYNVAKLLDVNDQVDNDNKDNTPAVAIEEEAAGVPREKPKMFKIDANNDSKFKATTTTERKEDG